MFRQSDIKRLINTFGKQVTIQYKSSSTYNPATGENIVTRTPATVMGYFYDIREEQDYDTFTQLGNRRLAINPFDTSGAAIDKPEIGDIATGHRNQVTVTRVDEVISGDQTMVYLLRVK